jgi:hypothetical protein
MMYGTTARWAEVRVAMMVITKNQPDARLLRVGKIERVRGERDSELATACRNTP